MELKTPCWVSPICSTKGDHFWSKSWSLNAKDKFLTSCLSFPCSRLPLKFLSHRYQYELGKRDQESWVCDHSECQDTVRRYHRELDFFYAQVSHFRNKLNFYRFHKNHIFTFTCRCVLGQHGMEASEGVSSDSEPIKMDRKQQEILSSQFKSVETYGVFRV